MYAEILERHNATEHAKSRSRTPYTLFGPLRRSMRHSTTGYPDLESLEAKRRYPHKFMWML